MKVYASSEAKLNMVLQTCFRTWGYTGTPKKQCHIACEKVQVHDAADLRLEQTAVAEMLKAGV